MLHDVTRRHFSLRSTKMHVSVAATTVAYTRVDLVTGRAILLRDPDQVTRIICMLATRATRTTVIHPTLLHAVFALQRGLVYLHTSQQLWGGRARSADESAQWHYVNAHADFQRMSTNLNAWRDGRCKQDAALA